MNYFGMMYKSFQLVGNTFNSGYRRYEFRFSNGEPIDGNYIDFLRRVFGRSSTVKEFGIHFPAYGDGVQLKQIKDATGPLKIEKFRITGLYRDERDEETVEIVNYVKDNTVSLLYLAAFRIEFVTISGNFFIEISSFVSTIKFEQDEYANYPEELDRQRRAWQKATDWLNATGKITAKLTEEPFDENKYVNMCITMERKGDN